MDTFDKIENNARWLVDAYRYGGWSAYMLNGIGVDKRNGKYYRVVYAMDREGRSWGLRVYEDGHSVAPEYFYLNSIRVLSMEYQEFVSLVLRVAEEYGDCSVSDDGSVVVGDATFERVWREFPSSMDLDKEGVKVRNGIVVAIWGGVSESKKYWYEIELMHFIVIALMNGPRNDGIGLLRNPKKLWEYALAWLDIHEGEYESLLAEKKDVEMILRAKFRDDITKLEK